MVWSGKRWGIICVPGLILLVLMYLVISCKGEVNKIMMPQPEGVGFNGRLQQIGHGMESRDNGRWLLVWEEEFEDDRLDPLKWNIDDWAATKNNELQYYTPRAVYIEKGCLVIKSEKVNFNGRRYISGSVNTKDKFSLLYGRIDIRARLPGGQGIFPAFWLLPENGDNLPEIDIMEMLGHEPNRIWTVLHFLSPEGTQDRRFDSHTGPDFTRDFHLFSLEWTPEELVWLVDRERIFTVKEFIPDTPMYLIINTAVGGDWPGEPDSTTEFPQYLLVDYIGVYTVERE